MNSLCKQLLRAGIECTTRNAEAYPCMNPSLDGLDLLREPIDGVAFRGRTTSDGQIDVRPLVINSCMSLR